MHGHRGTGGGELEELGVVRGEPARRERPDVQDADQRAAADERHAEQGPEPPLDQQRVEHAGGRHVRDVDGPQLRRDTSGEPLAHRDVGRLGDLLLYALRGRRHEEPPLPVEEQDDGGVRVQDLADAFEQGVQELVHAHVGERLIGDRQDVLELASGVLPRIRGLLQLPTHECDICRPATNLTSVTTPIEPVTEITTR
nr:hypothetical protein [Actinomadura latina]